jgi:YfiR/HmsC-like
MKKVATLIAITCLLFAMAVGSHAEGMDSSDSSEYLIKAGFIYNFAKLVEWPATAFPQPDSPIVIGILGDDPFGGTLDRIVTDKKINGRGFTVKRLKWGKDLKDIKDCNILFVSSSEKEHLDSVVDAMKWLPVLTIGDAPGFARRGGIINFTLEDNKVRFEVNVEAAKHADLTISSRLLTLARIVPQQVAADGRKPE